MAAARRMATLLIALMLVQSVLGLVRSDQYRGVEWIRATWYGNDWTTLVAAVPLFCLGILHAARGSVRGLLLVLGMGGYAVYNCAFYLFGAALNIFFPLYVVNFLLGNATLGLLLSHLDVTAVAKSFRHETPVRIIGGYLVFVALGLAIVWLGMWGAYAFAGRPTPIEPEAFKVVAARPLVHGTHTDSRGCVAVEAEGLGLCDCDHRGDSGRALPPGAIRQLGDHDQSRSGAAPGELPMWGLLTIFAALAAILLLRSGSGAPLSATTM